MSQYVVIAGLANRPEEVLRGVMEKGMGQSIIKEVGYTMTRRGDIGFPNRSETWGKRVIRDKSGDIIKEGVEIDVKDKEYKGEIEFLEWGDKKGQLIVTRYLKGYNTLDYLYQNLVLNADANLRPEDESSTDSFYIRLQSGDNVFDDTIEPQLVQFLKIQDYNSGSVSKNPNFLAYMFREKIFTQTEEVLDRTLDAKFESLKIVQVAGEDNSGQRLKNLFSIVQNIAAGDVKDNELFSTLKKLADSKPDEFIRCIDKYKLDTSNTFEKLKSYGAIDLTKDHVIVAGQNKKNIIGEDVEGKGDDMLVWCLTNFLDQKAYDICFQLKKISDKLK